MSGDDADEQIRLGVGTRTRVQVQLFGPITGRRGHVRVPDRGHLEFLQVRSIIKSTKAHREIGYAPRRELSTGIALTARYLAVRKRKGVIKISDFCNPTAPSPLRANAERAHIRQSLQKTRPGGNNFNGKCRPAAGKRKYERFHLRKLSRGDRSITTVSECVHGEYRQTEPFVVSFLH